jgi:hypothetical protein
MSGGASGLFIFSTDSIAWTLRTTGFGADTWSVAYGDLPSSTYVISGAGGVLRTSTDSISWTLRTTGLGTNPLNSTLYQNGIYCTAGSNGNVASSTDAISWTTRVLSPTLFAVYSGAVGDNKFIFGGYAGVYSSVDGTVWILRTSGVGAINAFAFGYGNGLFFGTYGAASSLTVASSVLAANGGNGVRGGGGGGGGFEGTTSTLGTGGTGGDGYVRISWQ